MVPKFASIAEAYETLQLEEGATQEEVRVAYKQLALKTHPDKNPDNADATTQFQHVGDAYNVLQKHFDGVSRPPASRDSGPFEYQYHGEVDYDEDEYYEPEENVRFYTFLFQEFMSNHFRRGGYSRQQYHTSRHTQYNEHYHGQHGASPEPQETQEEYNARIRRAREEQEEAAARRAQEEAARKTVLEKEREKEKEEAARRQKNKASAKKAQAEASRQFVKNTARQQLQCAQTVRSQVFAAARRGDIETVRKGIWEDTVDAAGGEIKRGGDEFVKDPPKDPLETIMHICARRGDVDLIEWLVAHSAEPEERNKEGLTPFHVALRLGKMPVVKYFLANHPPSEDDYAGIYNQPPSRSVMDLALDSREPEAVWSVLDKGLISREDLQSSWARANSKAYRETFVNTASQKSVGKLDEILNILVTYGGFSLDPAVPGSQETASSKPLDDAHYSRLDTPAVNNGGDNKPYPHQSFPNVKARGRGRGRGFRGKGRGRPPNV